MANYIVWHGKKRATLLRREGELLRLLSIGGPSEILLWAADELRASKVRYLRSEHSRLDLGNGSNADRLLELESEIRDWSSRDLESILEAYRMEWRRQPPNHTLGARP